MIKRIMAAGLAAVLIVLTVVPIRANAILPLGVIHSALATYVTSTGYHLWSEQGTGQDIVSMVAQLYDDFRTVQSASGNNYKSLTELNDEGQITVDEFGRWVFFRVAADTFQSFADWIKDAFQITAGDVTPTVIISGKSSVIDFGDGRIFRSFSIAEASGYSRYPYYCSYPFMISHSGEPGSWYLRSKDPIVLYGTYYQVNGNKVMYYLGSANTDAQVGLTVNSAANYHSFRVSTDMQTLISNTDDFDLPTSTVDPSGTVIGDFSGVGNKELGATITADVTDVAQGVDDDSAVVIGVGAAEGTNASDLADISAAGIKAQDLPITTEIVATDVIDTPAYPYPDVDSLGLPSLGAALVSRFPFCIPWDFVDTIRLLNAEPRPPYFQFDLIPDRVKTYCNVSTSTAITVDLSKPEYSKIGEFCRWGSLIGFCFGLALLTKRMIWTS